jgi:hypothetical protein
MILSKMGMRMMIEMGFKFLSRDVKSAFEERTIRRETYTIKSLGVPLRVMPAAVVPRLPSIWE